MIFYHKCYLILSKRLFELSQIVGLVIYKLDNIASLFECILSTKKAVKEKYGHQKPKYIQYNTEKH